MAILETRQAELYDYPQYYDLLFGSDWKAEFDFFRACFREHAGRSVKWVFEPACGTGRLLIRFARAGYEASGLDLSEKAIDYCNRRLQRAGFSPTAWVGDMSDFRLPRKVDAAYNAIGSFRHLPDEESAEAHLRMIARALRRGGIYILGFHLTPTRGIPIQEESWSARRGNVSIISQMRSIELDRERRFEVVETTFDVHKPTRAFRLQQEMRFRTYTAGQFQELLARVPELECIATYDYAYRIDGPIEIDAETEDVLFVLRKR